MRLQLKQVEKGSEILEVINYIKNNLKGKVELKNGSLIFNVPISYGNENSSQEDNGNNNLLQTDYSGVISEISGGVPEEGNTLNKLYQMIQETGSSSSAADTLIQSSSPENEGENVSYLVLSGLTIQSGNTAGQKIGSFTFNGETTSFFADLSNVAPIANPYFTGEPMAPTPSIDIHETDPDRIATAGYVNNYIQDLSGVVPEVIDTLTEIKDYLVGNEGGVGDIVSTMSTKLDKSSVRYVPANTEGTLIGTLYLNNTPNRLKVNLAPFAPIRSPVFTGQPSVSSSVAHIKKNDDSRKLATTHFVQQEIAEILEKSTGTLSSLRELLDTLLDDDGTTIESLLAVMGEKLDISGGSVKGDLEIEGNLCVGGDIEGVIESARYATKALKDNLDRNIDTTYAPLESPVFTGQPQAPTPETSVENDQIATTKYVVNTLKDIIQGNLSENWTLQDIISAINADKNYYQSVNFQLSLKQPANEALTSLAYLTTSANKTIYTTALNKYSVTDLTQFAREKLFTATSPVSARSNINALGTKTSALLEFAGFTDEEKIRSAETSDNYKALNSYKADVSYRCEGTADKATVLETPRVINGQVFDGSYNVCNFVDCNTNPSARNKELRIDNLVLTKGTRITVRFNYGNTATNPQFIIKSTGFSKNTINAIKKVYGETIVDIDNLLVLTGASLTSTSAYPIKYRGLNIVKEALSAGSVYDFVFDGEAWNLVGSVLWNDDYKGLYTQADMDTISWTPGDSMDERYLTVGSDKYVKGVSNLNGTITVTYGNNNSQSFAVEPFARSTAPSATKDRIWFDTSEEVIKYYSGTSWQIFGAAFK